MAAVIPPIPDERPLSAEEYRLARWILDHGEPEAKQFLTQLDRARVISRCGCGCASIDLEVTGERISEGGPYVLGDFLFGDEDAPLGVFVFQRGGRLAGLEVWGLASDPPRLLPEPTSLRSYDGPRA